VGFRESDDGFSHWQLSRQAGISSVSNRQRVDHDLSVAERGIRWFKLDAALAEYGRALAYPCVWNKNTRRWVSNGDSTRRLFVYSTITGIRAERYEIVPCWYNSRARIWEVFRQPAIHIGKADEAILEGNSGTVSRYFGGTETDTLANETVVNKFADIAAGDWVIYASIDGTNYRLGGGGGSAGGVPFLNNSGETILPYSVMAPVDSIVFEGQEYAIVEQPGFVFHTRWLINGATAIAPLDTGVGFWRTETSGPVLIGDDEDVGAGWGPMPFSWLLWPARMGFDLLSGSPTVDTTLVPGTTLEYANFTQRDVTRVFGKLYNNLDATQYPAGNASAYFLIWHRGTNNIMRLSGWNAITVYAPFLNKSEVLRAGTFGVADWYSDHWEGDFACDPDDKDTSQQSPGSWEQFIFSGGGGDGFNSTQSALMGGTGTGTGGY
jgi:hypothetical protein